MKRILIFAFALVVAMAAGAGAYISQGHQTVGVGGTFSDWTAAALGIGNATGSLTGDDTLEQISDIPSQGQAAFPQTLVGNNFVLINPHHYLTTLTTADAYGIFIQLAYDYSGNHGRFIIDGLRLSQSGSTTNDGYSMLSIYTASSQHDTVVIKNSVVDRTFHHGSCLGAYSPDNSQVFRCYNDIFKNSLYYDIANNGMSSASVIENCTFLRGTIAISSATPDTIRNCLAIGQTASAYSGAGAVLQNSGSWDVTGSAWNFRYLMPLQCVIDTFASDTNSLRLQDAPKFSIVADSGTSVHLAGDTVDVLGVSRNHGGLYSIGAYTYSPRKETQGQTPIGVMDTDFFAGSTLNSRWQSSGPSCTTSVSSGKLHLYAGVGWTNKLIDTGYGPSQLDFWKEEIVYKQVLPAGGIGLTIFPYKNSINCGFLAYASPSSAYYLNNIDTTMNGGVLINSAATNPANIQMGDSVRMTLSRSKNTITFSVVNLTRSGAWSGSAEVYYGSTRTPNVASFGVAAYTGRFDVASFSLSSEQNTGREITLGNSITTGYFATLEEQGYARSIQLEHPGKSDVDAGGGNRSDMLAAIKNDWKFLKPKAVYCLIGINDMLGAVPLATIEANIAKTDSSIRASGGSFAPISMYDIGGGYSASIASLATWEKANYQKTIDVHSLTIPLQDGLHPTAVGHALILAYVDSVMTYQGTWSKGSGGNGELVGGVIASALLLGGIGIGKLARRFKKV